MSDKQSPLPVASTTTATTTSRTKTAHTRPDSHFRANIHKVSSTPVHLPTSCSHEAPLRPHLAPDDQLLAACSMAFLLSVLYFLLFDPRALLRNPLPFPARTPARPAAPDFSHLAAHCAHVRPISTEAFVARQDALAQTLHDAGAAAYVAEPGANGAFFANLSGSAWWLSERPLLLIITPASASSSSARSSVKANISILTPAFEATRAKLLPIPSAEKIAYPEWPEDADPYAVAVSAIPSLKDGTVFVDGATRQFVVEGLQRALGGSVRVVGASAEVRRLRERKSKEELEIMKCVNEVRRTGTPVLHKTN